MKAFCQTLLFTMCAAMSVLRAQADNLPDVVELVQPSIVSVGALSVGKRRVGRFFGTGFVVGDGRHVVTNYHVVSDKTQLREDEQFTIFTGKGRQVRPYEFEIVLEDAAHDLVLLKFTGPAMPTLNIVSPDSVRVGELYAFTGFPIGSVLGQYPVTHQGIVSSIPPIVTPMASVRQLKPEHIKRNREPFEVFQLDAIAYPGSSGSPLYNPSNGNVVGIINSVFVKGTKESVLSDPSGIAYAIPSRHLLNMLQQAGLSH